MTKRYGTLAAVDGVTLEVGAGEVYALLGLNGAGKTTLIRMLLGMVRPTAGSLGLAGRPVTDRSVWAEVGYLVETPSAYPDLTVRENLDVARRLRRLPSRSVVDDAVDRFGLGPYVGSKARTLSLGNAQRLGLAKALLHQPRILVLDEPVNGLDPAGVVEVRTMLTDLARDDGVTVLLSSHLLGEVARVATRIGILHEGRLIEELDSSTLRGEHPHPVGSGQPGPRQGGVHPAGRRVRGGAARRRHPGTGGPGGRPSRGGRDGPRRGRRATHQACRGGRGPRGPLHAAGRPPRRRDHWRHAMSAALWAAVGAELVKVRRAVMLWATGIAFLVAALVGAFFMFVLQDPARARSLGLLGAKAQLSGGTADWAGYFALLAQMVAVGGMLLFGMVMIWLFGREFADRTAKDLLALPTSRAAVVVAKLVVALVWSAALTVEVIALSLPLGALLGLPGWSAQVFWHGVGVIVATAVLTVALATTYALAASWGRGYLAAVATLFVTAITAQIVSAVGYGAWFPWAVPSLMSGVAGPDQATPGVAGITSVLVVGVAASTATVLWWQRADHDR